MILARNVRKTFGHVVAVDDISFRANKGEIYGLLGPNGAGKTTTLRMLYGIFAPTSGVLSVDGIDVTSNRLHIQSQLGVLPDGGSLYKRLTARENIQYFAELHQMGQKEIASSIADLNQVLGMENIIDRRVAGFSQGERMKVCLARAIVHDPHYILLDEPTNGLDVITTRAVRNLLLRLKDSGKCIVFSSHLMHEVSNLCDRVGIIAAGKVVCEGSINQVVQQAGASTLEDAFVHFAYNDQKTPNAQDDH